MRRRLDQEYTKRILDATPDKRILTELVDHMPASATVPSPLKFFGYVPGEDSKVTYHKDIVRYYEALDKASPRVTMWEIGKTEEGRPMVALAVASEATIASLDQYKRITRQLTDPRALSESQARQLIATGKPFYVVTGSLHSSEAGSPEMLIEMAFRLAVGESPFIQQIRNNSVVVIVPVAEVDGHERYVDNRRAADGGQPQPGMTYWGKYVAHDNNRDTMGKGLALTHNVLKLFLDLRPQVLNDLHESVTLLYTSAGTGPVQHRDPACAGERVVVAGADRSDGDDQAGRAWRLHLQLLGWLGAEFPALDRRHAQFHRPVLRDAELRGRRTGRSAFAGSCWRTGSAAAGFGETGSGR